mgnify:CR=1 FL=1
MVSNVLDVLGAALALGIPLEKSAAVLADVPHVKASMTVYGVSSPSSPGRISAMMSAGFSVRGLSVLEKSAAVLADVPHVKGRVEVVPTPGRDYTVLIDYAHSPGRLHQSLVITIHLLGNLNVGVKKVN